MSTMKAAIGVLLVMLATVVLTLAQIASATVPVSADDYGVRFAAECTDSGDLFRLHVYFPEGLPAGIAMRVEKPTNGWCASEQPQRETHRAQPTS